ncbi:SH3 domain-binding protein 1 [Protopterus annectens]|uniref:SH3 domain-binding protein 1 n=1 Tax=Protopterus annectens TaxID=7888 RepID=UPI001CF9A6AA|nr:SH3 domain-binding protein 1 [Protopterus annectens]
MMKKQFTRMLHLASPSTGRNQEKSELLSEDLVQVEQRIEPVRRASLSIHKRLLACLQGQQGTDMDKRLKKLPLMTLSTAMAESLTDIDNDCSIRKNLEICCYIEKTLAKELAQFEISLEGTVLNPLFKLGEEDLPNILKHKKQLAKHMADWNNVKTRLSQAHRNAASGTGAGNTAAKLDLLKEEEDEIRRKVEQCRDEYSADLYHFSTKEDDYASYFITLLELQAEYHRNSLKELESMLVEIKENTSNTTESIESFNSIGVYGVALGEHLETSKLEIALPIEACVLMLLAKGMKEEGLFRLAAGASLLRRLKKRLDCGRIDMEEFYSDPHAVAGALKSYLRELPEPLLTTELYDEWFTAASEKDPERKLEKLQSICHKLPKENYTNFRYLIKFFAKLAEHQEVNKMSPSNIAIVLGPNLLWPKREGDAAAMDMASASSVQVVSVIEPIILHASTIFPGDIDFNVSGKFTPPPDVCDSEGSLINGDAASEEKVPPAVTVNRVPSFAREGLTKSNSASCLVDGSQPKVKELVNTVPSSPPPNNPNLSTATAGKRQAPTVPANSPALQLATSPASDISDVQQGKIPSVRKTQASNVKPPGVPPPLPPQPTLRRKSVKTAPSPPGTAASSRPENIALADDAKELHLETSSTLSQQSIPEDKEVDSSRVTGPTINMPHPVPRPRIRQSSTDN